MLPSSDLAGCPRDDSSRFQIQKIYIRNLAATHSPSHWEGLLFQYFSHFGPIIDLKVLETSWITSCARVVRLRDI